MKPIRPPTLNEFLLLALLAEGPSSGYDLERRVAERRLREWTPLATSGLYFILQALRRRGWIRTRREPSAEGPSRRVCSLSSGGRRALLRRVRAALSVAARPAPEVDLALMNLFRFPRAEFRGFMKTYGRAVAALLAETRGAMAARPWGSPARLIFARHVALLDAERRWAAEAGRVVGRNERRRW